jgi:hypothetical protein
MKSKKAEAPKAKPEPKLRRDVATFGGPIVYRVEASKAEAARLQAAGFRKIQASGDRYVMGADAATYAAFKGAK